MQFGGHNWVESEKGSSLYGQIISELRVGGVKLTAVSVADSAMASDNYYELIEMPGGLEVYVCISESHIANLLVECADDYSRGYTFGVFVGSLMTNVFHQLMAEEQ